MSAISGKKNGTPTYMNEFAASNVFRDSYLKIVDTDNTDLIQIF